MTVRISIHALCYKFQKRAWWQMSSLAAQVPFEGHPVPDFRYVLSTSQDDPYIGLQNWNDRVAAAFPTLQIDRQVWLGGDTRYGERGHVRTYNLLHEDREFLLFVDADQVYHKHFMARVGIAAEKHRGDHRVLATPRLSMSFEDGYALADGEKYAAAIPDPWELIRSRGIKTWKSAHGRICGAGFFQLIDVAAVRKYMMERWGSVCYVPPGYSRDTNILTASTNKMRSDRNFRMNVGGIVEAPELFEQIHLNHFRHQDPQWAQHPQH